MARRRRVRIAKSAPAPHANLMPVPLYLGDGYALGASGLPVRVEECVPFEHRYWTMKGAESVAARAALVESGLLRPEAIKLVAGEPRLVGERDGRLFLLAKAEKVVDYQGIEVHIDRPKGYVQRGKDHDGNEWERTYKADYGYIPRTKGGDGEDLDVFVCGKADAADVFWITQKKGESGTFDEYKLMLGCETAAEAKAVYLEHVPEKYFGGIEAVSVEKVKALLGLEPAEVMKALVSAFAKEHEATSLATAIKSALAKQHDSAWTITVDDSLAKALGFAAPAPFDPGKAHLVKAVPWSKDGEERTALGIVLVPEEVDLQNDVYSAEEIRGAAYRFMEKYRNLSVQHREKFGELADGRITLLESWLAPVDMTINGIAVKEGTWLMKVRYVDDALWEAVKSGLLTGFSIFGSALKEPEKRAA